ncbi:MAG TPA: hypothetical protein VF699_13415 [Caulobacteraceae bacterium]
MTDPQAPPAPRKRRRRLRWLPQAIFESLLIVFSLVLAMALGEWHEDRQRDERVQQARAHFIREICTNRARLTSSDYLPYHKRALDAWTELVELENPTKADRLRAERVVWTGFHLITFRDAVWRSVSGSTLVEYMEPEETFALADVYRQQEMIDTLNNSMMQAWRISSADAEHPVYVRESIQTTKYWLSDVYSAEIILQELYDDALKRLSPGRTPCTGADAARTRYSQ